MLGEHVQFDKKVEIFIRLGRFYFYRRSAGIFALFCGCLYLSKEKVFCHGILLEKKLVRLIPFRDSGYSGNDDTNTNSHILGD